jgi:putative ABC transport system permease protein
LAHEKVANSMSQFQETTNVIRMASWDFRYEWRISSVQVLGMASVLAPLLVLFGLKFGVIDTLQRRLLENPQVREIRPVGSGRFGSEWFDRIARLPQVFFLIPRTRTIAATITLQQAGQDSEVLAELIPTRSGDPLLIGLEPLSPAINQVILSAKSATTLGVTVGDHIDGVVRRNRNQRQEIATLKLTVVDIAAEHLFPRDGIFANLDLLLAVEAYRDGFSWPELGWDGRSVPSTEIFASYRLYVKELADVAVLRDRLRSEGLEVRTRVEEIEILQLLERNLSFIFWSIAGIGITGYLISLAASLWASVERKRADLSVIRLLGVGRSALVWFPVTHALLTSLFGIVVAFGATFGLGGLLNVTFASSGSEGGMICRLLPTHLAQAAVGTLFCAVLPALLAGYWSTRIEPAEGLRLL